MKKNAVNCTSQHIDPDRLFLYPSSSILEHQLNDFLGDSPQNTIQNHQHIDNLLKTPDFVPNVYSTMIHNITSKKDNDTLGYNSFSLLLDQTNRSTLTRRISVESAPDALESCANEYTLDSVFCLPERDVFPFSFVKPSDSGASQKTGRSDAPSSLSSSSSSFQGGSAQRMMEDHYNFLSNQVSPLCTLDRNMEPGGYEYHYGREHDHQQPPYRRPPKESWDPTQCKGDDLISKSSLTTSQSSNLLPHEETNPKFSVIILSCVDVLNQKITDLTLSKHDSTAVCSPSLHTSLGEVLLGSSLEHSEASLSPFEDLLSTSCATQGSSKREIFFHNFLHNDLEKLCYTDPVEFIHVLLNVKLLLKSTQDELDCILLAKSPDIQTIQNVMTSTTDRLLKTLSIIVPAFTAKSFKRFSILYAAGLQLIHPEEFNNPSSFLKIYGDPQCEQSGSVSSGLLRKFINGNWECSFCHNVNYPRRFRCNNRRCKALRDQKGDQVVTAYAIKVYHLYRSFLKENIER